MPKTNFITLHGWYSGRPNLANFILINVFYTHPKYLSSQFCLFFSPLKASPSDRISYEPAYTSLLMIFICRILSMNNLFRRQARFSYNSFMRSYLCRCCCSAPSLPSLLNLTRNVILLAIGWKVFVLLVLLCFTIKLIFQTFWIM